MRQRGTWHILPWSVTNVLILLCNMLPHVCPYRVPLAYLIVHEIDF